MFCFDIETMGVESTAVVLSFACTYFDPNDKPSPETLRKNTFFAKLNATDQIQRLSRTVDRGTIEWWAKQCENVKNKSFKPLSTDLIVEDALDEFTKWRKQYPKEKQWVWARGNLDQCVFNSLERACNREVIFPHYIWRDLRTAIDFLYNTLNGYTTVQYEGFDRELHITKHNPIDDCILDAMMLMYGVDAGESK
jgi:hypothetical protein